MTDIETKIREIIDGHIAPALATHGGGIEFVDFDEPSGMLRVDLVGMCGGCPHAQETMRGMVEEAIKSAVPEVREVVRI